MATSSIPAGQSYVQLISPEALMEVPVSQDTIKNMLIPFYGNLYNVSTSTLNKVISCESGFRQNAENNNPPIEDSVGLVQINLLSHHIPRYLALNASYSLNYLASEISLGHGSQWSCYRKAVIST